MSACRKGNRGFTLPEVLLTVAILVILLAVSAVEVIKYMDLLKITELDDAAREIYLAAENRAVLLQNSGASVRLLGTKQTAGTSPATITLSNKIDADKQKLAELLPAGVIDPALEKGYFYVLYDASSHHVTEVFYAEEELKETKLEDLPKDRSGRLAYYRENKANHQLVGRYSSNLAAEIATKPLPTPGVEVSIENGNQLILTVKYTLPAGLPDDVTCKPEVTLNYGTEAPVNLLNSSFSSRLTKKDGKDITASGVTSAEYTWVLDSLEQDGSGNFIKQFKGLFSNPDDIAFGGDFTVTASLTLHADGYIDSSFSAQDSDNSLFDTTSTDDTAQIANLRHLQNLDSDSSGAAGKKTAKQCADIDCAAYMGSKYEFKPIANNDLTSYDARRHEEEETEKRPYSINNLTVTTESATGKGGAGLFSSGGEITFQSILLDNPTVTSGKNAAGAPHSAGALIGYCWGPATFDYCQVIDAKVNGSEGASYSGGMVGHINQSKFTNCTVKGDTVIEGKNHTGGLVGLVDWIGSDFEKCHVINAQVTTSGVAGGLAGATWSGTVNFKDCSAESLTVKSTGGSYAGGLMGWVGNGVGTATFTRCDVGTNGTNISVSGFQAGGILGNADGNAKLDECTVGKLDSTGNVVIFGNTYAGGLVGDSLFGNTFTLTNCKVINAQVTGENWNGVGIAGGLVGSVKLGAFTECHAVNATVTAQVEAGGVAGRTEGTNLTRCWVYWDNNNTAKLKNGDTLQYQVIAGVAGGLVGVVREGGTIQTSFAATLVKGTSHAGGLVGYLPSPEVESKVGIETSYADCYLKVGPLTGDTAYAGGLVGAKNPGTKLTLANVYAAGEIDAEGQGAGLCGGWVAEESKEDLTATNAYAAVRYEKVSGGYALICNGDKGCAKNSYCLNDPWGNRVTPYDTMCNINLGDTFTKSVESHPYNLDGTKRTTPYPFPGLKDLPHYGDWPTS